MTKYSKKNKNMKNSKTKNRKKNNKKDKQNINKHASSIQTQNQIAVATNKFLFILSEVAMPGKLQELQKPYTLNLRAESNGVQQQQSYESDNQHTGADKEAVLFLCLQTTGVIISSNSDSVRLSARGNEHHGNN